MPSESALAAARAWLKAEAFEFDEVHDEVVGRLAEHLEKYASEPVEMRPAEPLVTAELLVAVRAVLQSVISGGSGPAAPVFDEFDAAVESQRGSWYTVDAGPLDALRRWLEAVEKDPSFGRLTGGQLALLEDVRRTWASAPELRLLQLLKNAIDRPEGKRLDKGRVFYYEDADLQERLAEWRKEWGD